jgi:hypothetical protein
VAASAGSDAEKERKKSRGRERERGRERGALSGRITCGGERTERGMGRGRGIRPTKAEGGKIDFFRGIEWLRLGFGFEFKI